MNRTRICAAITVFAIGFVLAICAQNIEAQSNSAAEIVLVLPFENTSDHPEYNWIGESFADSLASLLDKPGIIVISSDERAVAYYGHQNRERAQSLDDCLWNLQRHVGDRFSGERQSETIGCADCNNHGPSQSYSRE